MNRKGFTLIELMVVLAVSSVVMVILTDVILNMQRQKTQVVAEVELRENLGLALETIVGDSELSGGVATLDPQVLSLWQDGGRRQITYSLADDPQEGHLFALRGQVLYRQQNHGRNQPMANFLEELQVVYYAADGTIATQASTVACLSITVTGRCQQQVMSLTRRVMLQERQWLMGYWSEWRACQKGLVMSGCKRLS